MTTLIEQSTGLAIALFIGLALVGFVVSHQHYRQMIERELNTTKLTIPDARGEPQYLLSFSEDVTDRKRAEAQIADMAHHDALTDLPNRVAFSEYLSKQVRDAAASSETFAVRPRPFQGS